MLFAEAARRDVARAGAGSAVAGREHAIACRGVGVRFFTDRRTVTALSGIDLQL